MTQEEIDLKLSDAMSNLAKAEHKQASVWWTFLRGMLYGLGFFIGSALLATAVILVLSKAEGWGAVGGFIHNILQSAKIAKS